jgi:hypothetical protein
MVSEKIVFGRGHLSSWSGEFGGKVLAEVYNRNRFFSQMPHYKYKRKYIKAWIYW